MERFNPGTLLEIYYSIQQVSGKRSVLDKSNEIIPQTEREKYAKEFEVFEYECRRVGLKQSAKVAKRMVKELSKPTVLYGLMKLHGDDFYSRLQDEIDDQVFIEIDAHKQSLLNGKNLFDTKDPEVSSAFPSTTVDIEEAGKCLVFERWTASIFHLMRVMEVGLRVLGDTLKLPPSVNPSWENILRKCDEEQAKPLKDRSPEWKKNTTFLAEAAATLRSVKNAWRNPTMHIEKVYTEEQAQDIWNAVRGFMRQLATKLSEDTKSS